MDLNDRIDKWLKDTSKCLNISELGLKSWPKVLEGKENLVIKLDCSFNQLTSLPVLPQLIELICSNNQLTSLPVLPLLTVLNCHHNQLTSLPILPLLT